MQMTGLFYLYAALNGLGIILIVWTMALISHNAFLGINVEPWWLRESRRVSLALVCVGLALAARWHIDHGHGAWMPEYLILSGIDLYLGVAILSSYRRLHILGLTVG